MVRNLSIDPPSRLVERTIEVLKPNKEFSSSTLLEAPFWSFEPPTALRETKASFELSLGRSMAHPLILVPVSLPTMTRMSYLAPNRSARALTGGQNFGQKTRQIVRDGVQKGALSGAKHA